MLLNTPLVSCGHCVVWSSIYGFWLLLWYLVAIVLSVLLFTASDYSFGILWPGCCLFFYLRFLITPLVYCAHCFVCSSIYGFWLLRWYIVAIVLFGLPFTASDYTFGILWPLWCLFYCDVCSSIYGFWLLLWYLMAIVLFGLQFTASDYSFGIMWPLWSLFFYLRLLITPLVSCGHCVVCSSIYGFRLLLWYLVAIVLYVLLFTASDYSFSSLWLLCCLVFNLRLLITPLVSCGHCVVCSSIYGFCLLLWYSVAIVLSVLLFTASDYAIGILWPLCCLFLYLRLPITPLVSCGHCVVWSSMYGFRLLLWYLRTILKQL
jgi:hypothetical protein